MVLIQFRFWHQYLVIYNLNNCFINPDPKQPKFKIIKDKIDLARKGFTRKLPQKRKKNQHCNLICGTKTEINKNAPMERV